MADIAANDQGLIEENIFGFFRCDPMSLPILVGIRFVPIEACALIQRVLMLRHDQPKYTIDVYSPGSREQTGEPVKKFASNGKHAHNSLTVKLSPERERGSAQFFRRSVRERFAIILRCRDRINADLAHHRNSEPDGRAGFGRWPIH